MNAQKDLYFESLEHLQKRIFIDAHLQKMDKEYERVQVDDIEKQLLKVTHT